MTKPKEPEMRTKPVNTSLRLGGAGGYWGEAGQTVARLIAGAAPRRAGGRILALSARDPMEGSAALSPRATAQPLVIVCNMLGDGDFAINRMGALCRARDEARARQRVALRQAKEKQYREKQLLGKQLQEQQARVPQDSGRKDGGQAGSAPPRAQAAGTTATGTTADQKAKPQADRTRSGATSPQEPPLRVAEAGFVGSFLSEVLLPNLDAVIASGTRIVTNAGGANPLACARAIEAALKRQGVTLNVVAIEGDDLGDEALRHIRTRAEGEARDHARIREDQSPPALSMRARPASAGGTAPVAEAEACHAQMEHELVPEDRLLGAFVRIGAPAVAQALAQGGDIVITGFADPTALGLGAAIDHFGWSEADHNYLAGGALAAKLVAAGGAAAGGRASDWERARGESGGPGAPVVELMGDGSFSTWRVGGADDPELDAAAPEAAQDMEQIFGQAQADRWERSAEGPGSATGADPANPQESGGRVRARPLPRADRLRRSAVCEALLEGVGAAQAYRFADVTCDLTRLSVMGTPTGHIRVRGAVGQAPRDALPVDVIWRAGLEGMCYFLCYGASAETRAEQFCEMVLAEASERLRVAQLDPFLYSHVEILGREEKFGTLRSQSSAREVIARLTVRHRDAAGVAHVARAAEALMPMAPPGLARLGQAQPRPRPVTVGSGFALPRTEPQLRLFATGQRPQELPRRQPRFNAPREARAIAPAPPTAPRVRSHLVEVPLSRLASGRAAPVATAGLGGQGALSVALFARRPALLPWIWSAVGTGHLRQVFSQSLPRLRPQVELLPDLNAVLFVLSGDVRCSCAGRVVPCCGGCGAHGTVEAGEALGLAELLLAAPVSVDWALLGEVEAAAAE